MTLRLTIGIDPGNSGAVACVADGVPDDVFDMPTNPRATGTGRMIDAQQLHARLRDVLARHQGADVLVVLELVNGFSRDGGPFAFKFGQADGIARGVLGSLRLPVLEVRPQEWKGHFGLLAPRAKKGEPKPPAPGKDASRARVVAMFPDQALPFLRAKDDGRAEALLLALWAIETEAWAA